jgi:5-methylcytosine-specific restriction endonuclease McrA
MWVLMNINYMNFNPVTAGERLFKHILKDVLGNPSVSDLSSIGVLQSGGRMEQFSEYFLGAFAYNLTGRCIKKAQSIRAEVEDISRHQDLIINYFLRSLELPQRPGERNLDRLASLAFDAVNSSGKDISNRTKWQVRNGTEACKCYICGRNIESKSKDKYHKIQYEHIWPSSYGGDSLVENILPACMKCNHSKADRLLWQDSHIHSFILSPSPSVNEWKSITYPLKVAKHRAVIFDVASEREITLKEAAIEVGPMDLKSLHTVSEEDCVDFFNFGMRKAI